MFDSDLLQHLSLMAILMVAIIAFVFWRGRRAAKSAEALQSMLDEHGVQPNADLRDESGEVALLWVEPENLFIYANRVTGTNRRIDAADVASVELLENGLAVRHGDSDFDSGGIGDDIADGIHGMLPAAVQNKVERLEIKLKTRTGGPPLGYSIPVVEREVSPMADDYVKLRNDMAALTSQWRQMYELA